MDISTSFHFPFRILVLCLQGVCIKFNIDITVDNQVSTDCRRGVKRTLVDEIIRESIHIFIL